MMDWDKSRDELQRGTEGDDSAGGIVATGRSWTSASAERQEVEVSLRCYSVSRSRRGSVRVRSDYDDLYHDGNRGGKGMKSREEREDGGEDEEDEEGTRLWWFRLLWGRWLLSLSLSSLALLFFFLFRR